MRGVLCCLALLVSLALATDFQCSIQYRTPLMKYGFIAGSIIYSSTAPGRMLINFPKTATRGASSELYEFNGFNGYNGKSAVPYSNQLIFTSGSSCACETGYADYGLPLLSPDSTTQPLFDTMYQAGGKDAQGCTIYTLRNPFQQTQTYSDLALNLINVALTEVHLDSSNYPCYAKLSNGKTYSFSNCQKYSVTSATFAEPTGCKCGKPLDIAIVLDRSGSISVTEFKDEKGFVQNFTGQFEYGPLQANLALINFKAVATVALNLVDGVSNANVNAAVNALSCPKSCDDANGGNCNGNVNNCCCCCGTCIACGMQSAAQQLATGRAFAFKLMVLITDGYGNHLPGGVVCGNDAAACNQGLRDQLNALYTAAGGSSNIATYAIGVGADRDVDMDQLTIVAGNDPTHVLRVTDWNQLAGNTIELIARSCDENQNPCGGCCGFCSCGQCLPVDGCDAPTPCTTSAVPAGQSCCAISPVDCSNKTAADPCNTYTCDNSSTSATSGQCIITSSVDCGKASNTTCFNRSCVKETGLCKTVPLCSGVTECTNATASTDCDDKNLCTDETCNVDGACTWTAVNCTQKLGLPDKCHVGGCTPDRGCFIDDPLPPGYCDDNNNCTVDTCDPVKGCVHTNVTCYDGKACTQDLCDPINGCYFPPVVCEANASVPCSISFCETENGTCAITLLDCSYVFPTTVVLASSLTAAAIVGIVIAAVLCAAGVAGGGAYAYANAGGGGPAGTIANNPLYAGAGASGTNPMYKPGQ